MDHTLDGTSILVGSITMYNYTPVRPGGYLPVRHAMISICGQTTSLLLQGKQEFESYIEDIRLEL